MATKGYLILLGGMREIERILKERMHEDEETIEQNGVPLLVESMADQIDELKAELKALQEARPMKAKAMYTITPEVLLPGNSSLEAKGEAGELRGRVAQEIFYFCDSNGFRWEGEKEQQQEQWRKYADRVIAMARPAPADALPQWIVGLWDSDVANRPLVNRYRRTLDDVYRNFYRHVTGGKELPRPKADEGEIQKAHAALRGEKEGV